jgi:trk system potassium uptake protein TrkA
VEFTLSSDAPLLGARIGDVRLPEDSALVAILRGGRVVLPTSDSTLEAGDEVLAVTTTSEAESQLDILLGGSGQMN